MKIPRTSLSVASTSLEELDHTNAIKIASWTILSITVLVFIARQVMKAVVFRRAALDDLFILLATVFAVGLSITTFLLSSHGLGLSSASAPQQDDELMKGHYASQFLYISAICFAKISILVLFYDIVAVQRWQRRFVIALGLFVIAWSTASLGAVAFQCELPRPWETLTSRCVNMRIFWIIYCIIDMSTEFAIIMLSVNLVAYLQVQLSRKVAVVACFAPRVLVLAVALVRLIWLYPITPHSDPQYKLWLPAIISQVQVCLSIATASVPYMVPFFRGLDGNLRRTQSTKSRIHLIDEESGRSTSSLWFRRHKKARGLDLWDPSADTENDYERVPQVSPYLPFPRPMTPLSPPRLQTSPGRQASVRGLNIYIPFRDPRRQRSLDWASPRTESSCALSPSCTSPQALLMQSFVPSRKAPSPPAKIHSPNPPASSVYTNSVYSTRAPTPPASAPLTQRFSLFPPQRSPSVSPQPGQSPSTSTAIPPIRAMRSQPVSSTAKHPGAPSPRSPPSHTRFPIRSSSRAKPPKFSTTTHLQTPPLLSTLGGHSPRPGSIQDLTSPMGAALNNYFDSAEPAAPPRSPTAPPPSSLQQQRNHHIVTPTNTSRTPTSPPKTHTRSPTVGEMLRDDLYLPPQDLLRTTRNSRSATLPSVRDVRSSPRIVVRSPS
ncbi:hypothetical protein BDW02DRAFT_127647 [Decorospora gaudefroyi]|uniref:Rhodopsin domain-containing protein n=1 Tax=Decorospora gaudefroyi TaxID=184978 RepID=A0A6A5K0W5_9PLEO|nr:hypothetical protein BDW02DRAFT_127647 [Decorospora gaudefroyi]